MSIPQKYKNNIFYKTFHQNRLLYFKILANIRKNKINLINIFVVLKQNISNPKKITKGFKIFFTKGPKNFIKKIISLQKIVDIDQQYQIWFKKNWPNNQILNQQKKSQLKFKYRPKISIITPVYNPDKKWLESCIESVIKQTYDNWELCLADDASTKPHVKEILKKYSKQDNRIKVVYRPQNGHISKASNSALELASGEFVALLDHDDDLAPQALFKIVEILNKNKKIDFIYTDEDKVEINGKHVDPFFKPDWSPDMFLSTNYLCHLCVIRKKIVDKLKGFRVGYEGSQDYDLFLRVTEKTKNIYHIPEILYSWRKIPGSTAAVYSVKNYCNQASINTLQDAMIRRKIDATIGNGLVEGTFRVKYEIKDNPLVSIIIPTKDKIFYLKRCLESICQKTTYKKYEIIIIDTNSTEKETLEYYKILNKNKKIKFLSWKKEFNYSSVNNFAVKKAKGKYILLLNNDTEVITPNWIENMLEHAKRPEIGAVGVKLLYPDESIQHAGIIIGVGGIANHASQHYKDCLAQTFPMSNSKDMVRNFSAVTAACLMISKNKYLEINGFDEKFKIAFNDVDFCLKLTKHNYYNIYTPYTKLVHYESISIGKPENGTRKLANIFKEGDIFSNKWKNKTIEDPYYNKNLSKQEIFRVN